MVAWNDTQPIFVQIRQRIVVRILSGEIAEGDPLPSVRQVATELAVNPLTVTKAYATLVEQQTIEKRRGLGMFVRQGARQALLATERAAFLKDEWPRIARQIDTLGLSLADLTSNGTQK